MTLPEYTHDFCPSCGSSLGSKMKEGRERLYCSDCDEVVWLNPGLVGAVAAIKDEEVLLIKRGIEPNKGLWAFPAGFIERDEAPIEGAAREFKEETGLEADNSDLEFFDHIKIQNPEGRYLIVSLYLAQWEDVKGSIETGSEILESDFWSQERIVSEKDELEYEMYVDIIQELIEGRKEGGREVYSNF